MQYDICSGETLDVWANVTGVFSRSFLIACQRPVSLGPGTVYLSATMTQVSNNIINSLVVPSDEDRWGDIDTVTEESWEATVSDMDGVSTENASFYSPQKSPTRHQEPESNPTAPPTFKVGLTDGANDGSNPSCTSSAVPQSLKTHGLDFSTHSMRRLTDDEGAWER